jgi:putative chitinase
MAETFFSAAFKKLWPHADKYIPGLTDGIIASAPIVFPKYGLTTDLTICHAMAQFSEETGCGAEMQENMNYSAGRLLQVFPTHFTTSQAIEMQHNPRLIADQAYGSRMGNRPGTDDGFNKRGQGLSQLTGNYSYDLLSRMIGLDPKSYPQVLEDERRLSRADFEAKYPIIFDLVNHPELLIDPAHALECGVADFVVCGCLPYAEKDSLIGVSSMLNVGHFVSNPNQINGYSMRKNWLALWKNEMQVSH